MLRHGLREMEALLAATSAAVARSIATEKLLAKTRAEYSTQADLWQRRAAEAIAAGDEPLARRALARKLDADRALAMVALQLAEAHEANETLRRQRDLLHDKHAAARTKLMLLSAQQTAREARQQVSATSRAPRGTARSWARFDRFYEQVEFAQAEAAALLELETCGDSILESQFERRDTERAIDEELTRLKASQCAAIP